MPEELDVIVVGAGQAGLSLGYFLRRLGVRFLILEAADELGDSWRRRWDSLTLFTPAEFGALPGLPLPLAPGTYPGKDDVADYLRSYAETFELPVKLEQRVRALRRQSGSYRIETESDVFQAHHVVVATGPFQRPYIPPFSHDLAVNVEQLHSSSYKSPHSIPPGEVLVVGTGNSGWQIAEELAATRRVILSGRELPRVPRRLLGRSLFWWLETSRLSRLPASSPLGRWMRGRADIVIGEAPDALLRSGHLRIAPRAVGAEGDRVHFEDGSEMTVGSIVWATGYRTDFDWIDLPVFDDAGLPLHRRGVTDEPGLYFLGLPWLHTTGSALLGWVGRDAAFIARQIERRKESVDGAA